MVRAMEKMGQLSIHTADKQRPAPGREIEAHGFEPLGMVGEGVGEVGDGD